MNRIFNSLADSAKDRDTEMNFSAKERKSLGNLNDNIKTQIERMKKNIKTEDHSELIHIGFTQSVAVHFTIIKDPSLEPDTNRLIPALVEQIDDERYWSMNDRVQELRQKIFDEIATTTAGTSQVKLKEQYEEMIKERLLHLQRISKPTESQINDFLNKFKEGNVEDRYEPLKVLPKISPFNVLVIDKQSNTVELYPTDENAGTARTLCVLRVASRTGSIIYPSIRGINVMGYERSHSTG